MSQKEKNISDQNWEEARAFFLRGHSYCSFNLPPYFCFDGCLSSISKDIKSNNFYNKKGRIKGNPSQKENVNYKLFNNKDGQYAWRLLQLINPAIYVALVHKITEEENWKTIKDRFNTFNNIKNIECKSIPVVKDKKQTEKQILNWWKGIEQESIKLSLDYKYMFTTDITDCYGAIYTHSIPWAIHTKKIAKACKSCPKLIGNIIDHHLQAMSNGQTNGIPQGSILMHFIAEIVLGYADLELSEKIKEDFKIFKIQR